MKRNLLNNLITYVIPLFPVLFLAIPIAGTGKTVTLPKIVLPIIAILTPYSRKNLNTPGFWLFGAYLVWVTVGTIIRPSPVALWHLAEEALFILLLASVWTKARTNADVFWQVFRCTCLFLVVWAFALTFIKPPSLESNYYAVVGTPNVAGAFLAIAFLYSFHGKRYVEASCYILGILVFGSMGALVASLFSSLFLIRKPLIAGVVTGLIVGAIVNIGIVYGPGLYPKTGNEVQARPPPSDSSRNFWTNSMAPRIYIWKIASKAILSNATLGSGLGLFGEAFVKAEEGSAIKESRLPWWRWWKHKVIKNGKIHYTGKKLDPVSSHSDFLRVSTETGVIGGILWVLAIGALLWALRRQPLAASFLVAFIVQGLMEDLYSFANYVPVLWTAIALERKREVEAEALISYGGGI